MTMSKEMQLLKSRIEFCKKIIIKLDELNFITNSNKYDKMIEEYQNKLSEVYKRIQDLKDIKKYE